MKERAFTTLGCFLTVLYFGWTQLDRAVPLTQLNDMISSAPRGSSILSRLTFRMLNIYLAAKSTAEIFKTWPTEVCAKIL